MKAFPQVVLLLCIEGFVAQHLVRAGPTSSVLHEIRKDIKDDVKEILRKFHHIPAPDTDQCALSRLGLDAIFAQRQPYNLKSTSCQIQGAVSSNPIGCGKINGGNQTAAAGCGINTSIGTQPAFTSSVIRNSSSSMGPKNFVVAPPERPPQNRGRHLLFTEISASPLASYTNISGSVVTYNPNNSSIDSTDFYYAFENAYSGGYSTLRLVPGNYTIINPFGGFHFIAGCYSMQRSLFELDLGGSTFVLTDGTSGGFFFNYCNNVLVRNATIYYDFSQNPWYQATITDISPNGQVWNITVQDGYPIDYVTDYYQALCVPWDAATRLPLQNTSDIYPTPGATTSLGGNNFQFQFNYANFGVSVGNYVTCRGNQGNHGLVNWYSQNMTLRDITFYNPAVYGIYEETGNNNTYINNNFIPYPNAVGNGGAQQAPLQSCTADGFHASTSFMGPTLINNTILNTGDDGIAIHGRYYLVVAADPVGSNITIATGCSYPCSRLYQGTDLTAYTNETEGLGSTNILGITSINNPLPPNSVSITLPGINLNTGTQYLNLTVACWPSGFSKLSFDDLITSRTDEGDGFQVVGNQVGYNRGRGILLKASNGIITGNSFIKPKFIAAQITPEVYWQEADFASNIIITNNIFDSYYSGIVLGIFLDGSYAPGHFQNHYNVTISGNIIRNAADQPLLITSSTGVTVTNNLFDSVLCYPYTYGAAQSFIPLPQPPIFLAYASNVRVVNNTYNVPASCTYGNFSSPIQTLAGTVTGLSLT